MHFYVNTQLNKIKNYPHLNYVGKKALTLYKLIFKLNNLTSDLTKLSSFLVQLGIFRGTQMHYLCSVFIHTEIRKIHPF